MPSTATARNRFEKQGAGENINTWGTKLNTTGLDLIDEALDGFEAIAVTGDLTLTSVNYASDQARKRFLKFTGTVAATITIPAVSKLYFIWNATSASLIISMGGATTVTLASGARQWIACDGTAVYVDTSAPAAAASATSAATSATNAATSASAAATSASSAATSATSASNSASSAATSATNAATSATNAANSAASLNTSNLVDRTTAQSINGLKTFNDGIRINSQTLDGLTAFGVSLAEANDASAAKVLLGVSGWTLLSTAASSGVLSVSQTNLASYYELLIVYAGVQQNSGSAATLSLQTSENNGSSYVGSCAVAGSIASGSPGFTGSTHAILGDKATLCATGTNGGTGLVQSSTQAAKANAVQIAWTGSTQLTAGTITIYAR